jgi:hypothetical protein
MAQIWVLAAPLLAMRPVRNRDRQESQTPPRYPHDPVWCGRTSAATNPR